MRLIAYLHKILPSKQQSCQTKDNAGITKRVEAVPYYIRGFYSYGMGCLHRGIEFEQIRENIMYSFGYVIYQFSMRM